MIQPEATLGNSAPTPPPPPRSWFEADHERLVREIEGIEEFFPNFTPSLDDGRLCFEGELQTDLLDTVPLRVRLTYPSGFPAAPIRVLPLSPHIPTGLWGHEWHRWDNGSLCLGNPDSWDITYTGRDVLEKASEWYFNFLAAIFNKVERMPDVGRAQWGAADEPPVLGDAEEQEAPCS